MLKTSEFSLVRSTSVNYDVFNSRDDIYLVFTEKKSKFSFYFIIARSHHRKGAVENAKTKFLANPSNFGTEIIVTF